jgi:hypothetical protein
LTKIVCYYVENLRFSSALKDAKASILDAEKLYELRGLRNFVSEVFREPKEQRAII